MGLTLPAGGKTAARTTRGTRLPVLVAALSLAAVLGGLLASTSGAAPATTGRSVLAVGVLLVVAGGHGVRFWVRGEGDRLDLTEVALAVALLALPGALVVLLVALVKAVTLAVQRVPPHKIGFNVAQRGASAAAAAVVLAALRAPGPPSTADLLPLLLAVCAACAVNVTAVGAVLADLRGDGLWAGVRPLAAGAVLDALVNLTLGTAAAALWIAEPAAWPALLPMLLAVHVGARVWVQREAAVGRLVGVQCAAAVLAGAEDLDAAALPFLRQLRVAFECGGAELHLLADERAAPAVSARTWGRDGSTSRASEDLVAALLPLTAGLRVPDADRPELQALLPAGWRDLLAVPVRSGTRVHGLLLTHDREGWEGFESSELTVLEAAGQVVAEVVRREHLARAAAASDSRWRSLVQHASDLVLVLDGEARVLYASPAAGQVLGEDAPLVGGTLLARIDPLDRVAVEKVLEGALGRGGGEARVDFRTRSGSRDIEAVVNGLGDGSAELVLNARDVTARRQSERWWADQARVLELVARGAGLVETLAALTAGVERQLPGTHCVVLVGPQVAPVVHGSLTAPVAAALVALVSPRLGSARPASTSRLQVRDPSLLRAGIALVQTRALTTNGDHGWGGLVLCHPGPVPRGSRLLLEGATRVAALAIRAAHVQDRLAHQAAHDPLTDLPNRTLFLDRLAHALRGSEREGTDVLVLFLDLDRFKVINDSLGHAAGDDLLRAVGIRLQDAVRPGDTVARFGGDEFTMLCEGIEDDSHALRVVERVRSALARPFPVGDSEVFATSSIGMALGRGRSRHPELLVEDADAAMYRAKERGGDRVEVFDAPLRDRAQLRLDTQSALHRALERDEFRVEYQPIVDLRTGSVLSAEALVRWERTDRGTVQPDTFIPLAEETGLIVPIGARVLELALREAVGWHRVGDEPPPSVSVNLSPRQLLAPHLVELVASLLRSSGLAPGRLTLEITESALLNDVDKSGATLEELKALGVQLFVDDFGTGYSSLTYLQRFPVDGVKVDRSFVSGLGTRADDSAIVRAVVGLGNSLGLAVVAEGVETAEQVRVLRELDCGVGQGWLFGRAVPAADLSLSRRSLAA